MTHREHCQQIIAKEIDLVGRDDLGRLKRALFHAYPYGERKYYPYKVWCEEVRKALGTNKVTLGETPLFEAGSGK